MSSIKRHLYILILCSTSLKCLGQLQVDSLNRELLSAKGTELIDVQLALSRQWLYSDIIKADSLARAALKQAVSLDYKKGIVLGKASLGAILNNTFKIDSAKTILLEAIELAKEIDFKYGLTGSYLNYGSLLLSQLDYEGAAEQHLLGAKIASMDSSLLEVELAHLMNLGVIEQTIGEFDNAEKHFLEALGKAERPEFAMRTAQIQANLGVLEFKRNNFGKSIDYHQKAYQFFKEFNIKRGIAISSVNIGLGRFELGTYEIALEYYLESLRLRYELKDKKGEGIVLRYIGEALLKMDDIPSAKDTLEASLDILVAYNDFRYLNEVSGVLAELCERNNNFKQALEFERMAYLYRDSLAQQTQKKDISIAVAKFEIEKLQRENELAENIAALKLERRSKTIIVILFALFVLLVAFFWVRQRLKHKLRIQELSHELQVKEAAQKTKELEEEKAKLKDYTRGLLNSFESLEEEKNRLERKLVASNNHEEIKELVDKIKASIRKKEDWTAFRLYFDKAYPDFFELVKKRFRVNFTFNEERLISLIKINLSNKEIGIALNIQRDSVVRAKIRLKERLGLNEIKELEDQIQSIQ